MDGRSHGCLDEDLANVLPLLLQKTGQKVGRKLRVDHDLLGIHVDVTDGNIQAHDFLHLELDGGLDLIDFVLHVFSTSKEGREFTSLGETRTQETRDLLDHAIRRQEEIITLGKLLDQFLVLVELLQVFNTHVVDFNTGSLFAVSSISKNTALESRAGDGGELEGACETFVADRIVVLQSNLNLNGFSEVSLLSFLVFSVDGDGFSLGKGKNVSDSLIKDGRLKLRHGLIFKGLFPSL